ncbi:hyaluronidase-4-like [Protopterus annectens]|uniref:hyaluronidase-4-like n=1 Tax=Protopterus annectens TaxID=7888 RepID=UPI001CF9AF4B|nr:hyaluronidase-4-like [Protopterus annectens]
MGAAGTIIWGDSLSSGKNTCEIMKKYVDSTLGFYVLNVSTAALKCSQTLCNGNGRCLRKDSEAGAFLHLNTASFKITQNDGEGLQVKGDLSPNDVQNLRKKFVCQCYQGWQGNNCVEQVQMHSGVAGSTSSLLLTLFIVLAYPLLIL